MPWVIGSLASAAGSEIANNGCCAFTSVTHGLSGSNPPGGYSLVLPFADGLPPCDCNQASIAYAGAPAGAIAAMIADVNAAYADDPPIAGFGYLGALTYGVTLISDGGTILSASFGASYSRVTAPAHVPANPPIDTLTQDFGGSLSSEVICFEGWTAHWGADWSTAIASPATANIADVFPSVTVAVVAPSGFECE